MAAADRESQTAADMAAAAEEEEQKGQQERERDPADEFWEEAVRNQHWVMLSQVPVLKKSKSEFSQLNESKCMAGSV